MVKLTRCLGFMLVVVGCCEVVSYGQIPRYSSPSGSPLPSQLNYFKRDSGVLDTYNGIVEPQRQVVRQFQAQGQENVQLQKQLTKSQSDLEQIRDSEANVTGTGSGFMNSRRYFMNTTGGGGMTRSSSPRKYTFSKTPRANASQANAGSSGTGS